MRKYLMLGAALLVATPCLAQLAEPPPPPPGPRVFPPSDGPGDIDPSDRFAAYGQLLPHYINEASKEHFRAEVVRQQHLYPNLVAGAPHSGAPAWVSAGPRTDMYTVNGVTQNVVDSGRLRSIVPNPANPDQAYVLTAGGGLWRTNTLSKPGSYWTALSDGVVDTGGAAAIGRRFETVYFGSGDPFETTPALGGYMLASNDGGLTFPTIANLTGATQVRDVAVDTSATTDIVLSATDVGIFRSTDAGATYTLVTGSGPLAGLESWSIKRTSAGWLATFVQPGLATVAHAAASLAISTDKGATWTPIADTTSFVGAGRVTAAVGAPGDASVYAIASDDTGYDQFDMLRSVDGGQNWTRLGLGASKAPINPNCYQPNTDFLNGQAYYNQSLLVDPSDATRNTAYLGGNLSLGKTTDGGASFKVVGTWLPGACSDGSNTNVPYVHADHHTNAVITVGGKTTVAFGTDGGLFLSSDGGASFDNSHNQGLASLLTETVASSKNNVMFTGLQDNGVRARFRETGSWNQIFGGDGEGVGGSQANNAVALVSGYYLNIYGIKGSIPHLGSFTNINNNFYYAQNGLDLTDPDYFPFFTPIATPTAVADPSGKRFYTLTGSTFYKTEDGGQNWSQAVRFTDSSNNPQYIFRLSWDEIGLSPTTLGKIAVGGTSGHAVITTDGFRTNKNFHYVSLNNLGLGYASFNSSAAWTNADTIYFSSQAPTAGAVRVLTTADYGTTWKAASNGLPDVPVNQVVADNTDATGKTLYAATWIGVYATHDGGANWAQIGAGLPVVQVSSIELSPNGTTLRAATYGRGIWTLQVR